MTQKKSFIKRFLENLKKEKTKAELNKRARLYTLKKKKTQKKSKKNIPPPATDFRTNQLVKAIQLRKKLQKLKELEKEYASSNNILSKKSTFFK